MARNGDISISFLKQNDITLIVAAFAKLGWDKPTSLYEKYFEEQENAQRAVWVAFKGDVFTGYVTLKWYSDYAPFRKHHIPEISDLNILPEFRTQGVASTLLEICETEACKKSSTVGIGVGLFSDYGAAQRLYIKRGYIPDGRGITYNYLPVSYGEQMLVDDNLVLWFTKKLT